MNAIRLSVVGLAVVFVFDSVAEAQNQRDSRTRGGFGRRTLHAISLAAMDQVQKELKVSDEQAAKIHEVSTAYRTDSQALFAGLQGVSREERAAKMAELSEKSEQLAANAEKKLAGILDEAQAKRLQEIVIQVLGHRALLRDDVQAALGLSDDQKKELAAIFEPAGSGRDGQGRRQQQGGNFDRDAARARAEAREKELNEKVSKILSEEQSKAFAAMQGEKFELQFERRQRNRDDA